MNLVTQLVDMRKRAVDWIRQRTKPILFCSAIILLIVLSIGVVLLLRPHTVRHTNTNNRIPKTGISIVFRKALSAPATVEIDDSLGKKVSSYELVKTTNMISRGMIIDPKGIKYNIPLSEGVYILKVSGSNKFVIPLVETVTVPEQRLTTVNIGII